LECGFDSIKTQGLFSKITPEGVSIDLDRRIGSERSRFKRGRTGAAAGQRRRPRGGAPLPAVTELAGASENGLRGHHLTPDLHEMKEVGKAVLTERKTKTGVDQGQLTARDGGRLLPVKFGGESRVSREPNKGKRWCGEGPYRATKLGNVRNPTVGRRGGETQARPTS
jgi:hypothetical protein